MWCLEGDIPVHGSVVKTRLPFSALGASQHLPAGTAGYNPTTTDMLFLGFSHKEYLRDHILLLSLLLFATIKSPDQSCRLEQNFLRAQGMIKVI